MLIADNKTDATPTPGFTDGALSAPLATGSPITSLPVTALPTALSSGTQVFVRSGANTQIWVLTADAALGATALAVVSQTPNFAYPSGSVVATLGDHAAHHNALADGVNAATTAIAGLGSASTHSASDFDAAGAAAAVDAAGVHKTGAETVAGIKTFSSSPVVPTPGGTTDAANKGYADSAVGVEATARANADSAHAALTTTAHGGIVASSDGRLSDARTPLPVTKRITLPITGGSGTQVSSAGAVQDWLQRALCMLPCDVTRFRLKARNWANVTDTAHLAADPVTASAVYVGTPSFSGTSRWTGTFAAAPLLAIPAGLPITVGADAVSAWCTDPAVLVLMRAGMAFGVSVGFTGTAATAFNYETNAGWYFGIAGASAAAGNAGIPGGAAALGTLDLRIEYETSVLPGVPVTMCVGDSITSGTASGGELGSGTHESWPGALALKLGAPVVNLGCQSSVSSAWANTAQFKYQRADLATTVPDQAIVAIGTNDIAFGTPVAATVITNILAIVDAIRALGVRKVYVATIIPDNLAGANETARLAVNDAIREGLPRVAGVIDFDAALRVPAAQATVDPTWLNTYPHPRRAGLQNMASVASAAVR